MKQKSFRIASKTGPKHPPHHHNPCPVARTSCWNSICPSWQGRFRRCREMLRVFWGHGDAGCGEMVVGHWAQWWGVSGNLSLRFSAIELWGHVVGKTLAILAAEQAFPKWETGKAFPSAVPLGGLKLNSCQYPDKHQPTIV